MKQYLKEHYKDLLIIAIYAIGFITPTLYINTKLDYLFQIALINSTVFMLNLVIDYKKFSDMYHSKANTRMNIAALIFNLCLILILFLLHITDYLKFNTIFVAIDSFSLLSIFKAFGIMLCMHANEVYLYEAIKHLFKHLRKNLKTIIPLIAFFIFCILISRFTTGNTHLAFVMYYLTISLIIGCNDILKANKTIYIVLMFVLSFIFSLII